MSESPRGSAPAELLHGWRTPRYVVLGLVFPLLVYVLYEWVGMDGVGGAPRGLSWSAYFMVSMAVFGATNAAVLAGAGAVRQAASELSHAGRSARFQSHLLARAAVAALVLSIPPIVLMGIVGAVDGVRLASAGWLEFVAALWLGALPFAALGVLLTPTLKDEAGEVALVGALVLLAILGGLFEPISTLPAPLAELALVLPSYRLGDLGWSAITARPDAVDVLVLVGYAIAFGALVVWRRWSVDETSDLG